MNIQHRIQLVAQPTNMTCWSAAASMIFGGNLSVGAGGAALGTGGGLFPDFSNIERFAHSLGLRMYAPQSWSILGLALLLENGPVIKLGYIPSGHAVVIAGIETYDDNSNAILTIYDPWPPNIGSVYKIDYVTHVQQFPFSTNFMLQR